MCHSLNFDLNEMVRLVNRLKVPSGVGKIDRLFTGLGCESRDHSIGKLVTPFTIFTTEMRALFVRHLKPPVEPDLRS